MKSSQTSEQEREETRKFLEEFFVVSTEKNEVEASKYCWLETTARPPVRKRTTNIFNQKISAQIICQDIEDETPFVKLVHFNPKHFRAQISSLMFFSSFAIFLNSFLSIINELKDKIFPSISIQGKLNSLSLSHLNDHFYLLSLQWYGPLQPPPPPEQYKISQIQ